MNARELDESTFAAEALESSVPVLVDFWAPWCPPCRRMGPVLDELATELAGRLKVVKVNTEEAASLAARYHVLNLPTFLLFKGGQVATQLVGARSKDELLESLEPHLA